MADRTGVRISPIQCPVRQEGTPQGPLPLLGTRYRKQTVERLCVQIAAEALGIGERTLYRKIAKYGLET